MMKDWGPTIQGSGLEGSTAAHICTHSTLYKISTDIHKKRRQDFEGNKCLKVTADNSIGTQMIEDAHKHRQFRGAD